MVARQPFDLSNQWSRSNRRVEIDEGESTVSSRTEGALWLRSAMQCGPSITCVDRWPTSHRYIAIGKKTKGGLTEGHRTYGGAQDTVDQQSPMIRSAGRIGRGKSTQIWGDRNGDQRLNKDHRLCSQINGPHRIGGSRSGKPRRTTFTCIGA